MPMTKKLANQISNLINEITVSEIMQRTAQALPVLTTEDIGIRMEKIRFWRENHDQAAEVLNGILGQEAVVPYQRKKV